MLCWACGGWGQFYTAQVQSKFVEEGKAESKDWDDFPVDELFQRARAENVQWIKVSDRHRVLWRYRSLPRTVHSDLDICDPAVCMHPVVQLDSGSDLSVAGANGPSQVRIPDIQLHSSVTGDTSWAYQCGGT